MVNTISRNKILIVEDNSVLSETIKELLELNDYVVNAIIPSGENIIETIENTTPDVILMDIKLSGREDGISIAEKIREKFKLPLIFLTSYSDSTTVERAKKLLPEGYIIKPFSKEVLLTTLNLVINKFYQENDTSNKIEPNKSDFKTLFIRENGWLKKITIDEIGYIKTEGSYCQIQTRKKLITIRSTVKELFDAIPLEKFVRVHKSYMVNLENLEAICNKEALIFGEKVPVGRNFYTSLQNLLNRL